MKLVRIILKSNEKFENRDAEKLRGYFGRLFQENILFHNHKDDYNFNYDFSFIQYKVKNGEFLIVGIDKGGDILLEKIEDIREIVIGDRKIEITPEINISFPQLRVDDEKKYRYRFETIWLALNDKNFLRYKVGEFDLNKQLANNILEFFKMCGIRVEKRVEVVGEFQELKLRQKDTTILGFVGEFVTNAYLPDDISLGKRKSIGMGRIKRKGEV
ncbi:CRISPR-associated endonuclease Cas6 [uncultured Fusobacterium sp.]|uniref:CRISPR-associated endonuclease Cas6 n=1 Tax=uncultured Fusobacterium sp. TaxID=159267 RepID=UPI0025EF9600|nr:CRISPR-associated endonuclease Cas6 [uncultured Fusobacterium sp.]